MTEPAAIQGTFSDLKTVKTRSVVQMVIEIPIEHGEQIIAAFGFPRPGEEVPVAVARLIPEKAQHAPAAPETKAKRHWDEMSYSQQAGIRCQDERFWRFASQCHNEFWNESNSLDSSEIAADFVRQFCTVDSRADLDGEDPSFVRTRWRILNAEFEEWDNRVAERR